MPQDLPQGTAVVSYRVISQDGHPIAGSMVFSIGAPDRNAAVREHERPVEWC